MTTSLRRSGARTRTLAALVSGVALTAALAGCGSDDGGDTAADPAGSSSPATSESPSESPSETPSETPSESSSEPATPVAEPIDVRGSAGATEAVLLTGTDAGGQASDLAFALDTDQARADFVSQLDPAFGAVVSQTAADQQAAASGATTYGAVAGVGCERPRQVAIEPGEAGFQVVAKLPKGNIECFAAMTFVIVFTVPDA